MKKAISILILCIFFHYQPGWNKVLAQTPLNFHGSPEYSPVIVHGGSGSWDEWALFLPYAIKFEGTFYIYYTGFDVNGIASIGMAISLDGTSFTKYPGNPVLTPSSSGFDAYNVTQGVVIEDESGLIMYYDARQQAGFGPGPFIGRATSPDPQGPWTKSADPVLVAGSPGEWDSDFIGPNNVFPLETGGYIMFYSGGDNFSSGVNRQIGMATSPDGIEWTKYDDPLTTDPPYTESDPVLKVGNPGEWDDSMAWECSILKANIGYEMYYSGNQSNTQNAIGYAASPDGISWTKYTDNPAYEISDDPYASLMGYTMLEQPSIIMVDSVAFMYYDYGIPYPGEIGMAIAEVPGVKIDENTFTKDACLAPPFPNPFTNSATFEYTLEHPSIVNLSIYSQYGQCMAVLKEEDQGPGRNTIYWKAGNLPSGVYFYRLTVLHPLPADSGKADELRLTTGLILKK